MVALIIAAQPDDILITNNLAWRFIIQQLFYLLLINDLFDIIKCYKQYTLSKQQIRWPYYQSLAMGQ